MTGLRLLVVEDDADLRSVLRRGLTEEGFEVTVAADGAGAIAAADSQPDALVVDIGLPDADGRDVCQALRARGAHMPVLFLTARDTRADRLSGFASGGDDYVTKPFDFAEVVARLRALLRRAGTDRSLQVGGLRLDPVEHAIALGGERSSLTPTEFRLLAALAAQPGDAVRRATLVAAA